MTWTPPPPKRGSSLRSDARSADEQRRRWPSGSPQSSGNRRRTASARSRSRGQTAQDFAVGIGLFLLAVAFVFALVPEVLAPLEAGATASKAAQADRAATLIVGNLTVDDQRPNELDNATADAYFDSYATTDDEAARLRNETGLPFTARVNVEITELDEDGPVNGTWSAGRDYREGFDAASATRIVRTNEPDTCTPGCKVLVRVW